MFSFIELRKLSFWLVPQVYGDPIDLEMYGRLTEAIEARDEDSIHLLLGKELPTDVDLDSFLW